MNSVLQADQSLDVVFVYLHLYLYICMCICLIWRIVNAQANWARLADHSLEFNAVAYGALMGPIRGLDGAQFGGWGFEGVGLIWGAVKTNCNPSAPNALHQAFNKHFCINLHKYKYTLHNYKTQPSVSSNLLAFRWHVPLLVQIFKTHSCRHS